MWSEPGSVRSLFFLDFKSDSHIFPHRSFLPLPRSSIHPFRPHWHMKNANEFRTRSSCSVFSAKVQQPERQAGNIKFGTQSKCGNAGVALNEQNV